MNQRRLGRTSVAICALGGMVGGMAGGVACTGAGDSSPIEAVAHQRAALGSARQPIALHVLQGEAVPIHGIEMSRHQARLFMTQPLATPTTPAGVWVASGLTGADLGGLAPPAGGFNTPLSVRIIDQDEPGFSGHLVVLDDQGSPAQIGLINPVLYFYSFSGAGESFHSTLENSVVLPGAAQGGPIYPLSMLVLGNLLALSDPAGAIWTIGLDGTGLAPAYVNPNLGFGLTAPLTTIGEVGDGTGDALGTIQSVTELLPPPPTPPGEPPPPPGFGLGPGLDGIALSDTSVDPQATDEVCVSVPIGATNPDLSLPYQGVHCLERTVLLSAGDPTAKPLTRSFVGVESLALVAGLDISGRWLYAERASVRADGKECVVQMDLSAANPLATLSDVSCTDYTGTVGSNVDDSSMNRFDPVRQSWAYEIRAQRLSPGIDVIGISIGQEYNNPDVNIGLGGVPKFYGPRVFPAAFVALH